MADQTTQQPAPLSTTIEQTSPVDAATDASAPVAQPASTPGEHCVTDRPTPAGQAGTGEIIKLNDIDVYISKPADYPHVPSRLLLLLTGGTGIKSANNQIQADRYAAEGGYLVLMPDMFGGDTAPGLAVTDDSTSLLEQIKIKAVEVTKSFFIDMWLAKVTPDRVMPKLHKVLDAAHDQFADAVRHGGGVYAVGYCVGGRFVLLLAQENEQASNAATTAGGETAPAVDEEAPATKQGPYIKAGAVAHAASVVPDDFKNIKVPLSLVCVEDDPLFPDEVRTAGEDLMSKDNVEHQVSVYPGVPHGFAVVGEYADANIKEAQAAAFDQMLDWIKNH